ncbi:MAG: Phosphoserine phosphatase 1 [Syntrophorhabdus sp. PtaU1.Bin002]|nr:MAG: Phosphoserine phosphatase 1 [Syntrophorhabdus sp. PtaU1.Bin002]
MDKQSITRIVLVRHGETTDEDTKKIYKGTLDIPLSAKGIVRLKRVASHLALHNLDCIYTSVLSRAVESGRIIAGPHNLDIISDSSLNELHFGRWQGLSFNEIAEKYPDNLSLWLQDPENHPPLGGEPLLQAQKRIMGKFREIVDRHKGGNVGIVAHGGALRIIVCTLLSVKLCNMFRVAQDHGCINIVDIYDDSNPVITLLNFTV